MAQKPTPDPAPAPASDPTPDPAPAAAAAAKKRAAAKTVDDPGMVDSLLAERRGYVQRNLPERVKLVDEQIRFYGGEPPAAE